MKRKIIFICLLLFIGTVIAIGVYRHKKMVDLETEVRLGILYKWQNKAFIMDYDHETMYRYLSAENSDLSELAIYLYVYNSMQNKYQLTVDEVLDYLSEEYDSDGKLRVYSRPENIEDYIDNYPEVDEIAFNFRAYFIEYMKENNRGKYWEMDYKEVVEALEKYKNDPEYIPPHEKEEEPSVEVTQEEIMELTNKLATKKYEMEKAGYSEEEINEVIDQMIEDYKNELNASDKVD